MRGQLVVFLMATVVALVAGGCGRSNPPDSVAVRASGAGAEIIYISCSPVAIDSIAVVSPTNADEYRESDPAVWTLSFPKPRPTASTFVVGQTPDRAIVDVPLASPLAPGKTYLAVVYLDGGDHIQQTFELDQLDGRVAYDNRYLSPDAFTRATTCSTP